MQFDVSTNQNRSRSGTKTLHEEVGTTESANSRTKLVASLWTGKSPCKSGWQHSFTPPYDWLFQHPPNFLRIFTKLRSPKTWIIATTGFCIPFEIFRTIVSVAFSRFCCFDTSQCMMNTPWGNAFELIQIPGIRHCRLDIQSPIANISTKSLSIMSTSMSSRKRGQPGMPTCKTMCSPLASCLLLCMRWFTLAELFHL